MKITKIREVYFSPTGTTRKVSDAVVKGMGIEDRKVFDLTKPENREEAFRGEEDELLILSVPVYMGRVPELLGEWFEKLQLNHTPVIGIAVYGNRTFGDTLLELKNLIIRQGGIFIAAAAFIGEHSFSEKTYPIAAARPDTSDLELAEKFGMKIVEKLSGLESFETQGDFVVPGKYPYEGSTTLWDVDFMEVSDQCSQCGICAGLCPMGAISTTDSRIVDIKKCVTCCACIKGCPSGCRSMKAGPVMDAAVRLNSLFKEPKQPEFFF